MGISHLTGKKRVRRLVLFEGTWYTTVLDAAGVTLKPYRASEKQTIRRSWRELLASGEMPLFAKQGEVL